MKMVRDHKQWNDKGHEQENYNEIWLQILPDSSTEANSIKKNVFFLHYLSYICPSAVSISAGANLPAAQEASSLASS